MCCRAADIDNTDHFMQSVRLSPTSGPPHVNQEDAAETLSENDSVIASGIKYFSTGKFRMMSTDFRESYYENLIASPVSICFSVCFVLRSISSQRPSAERWVHMEQTVSSGTGITRTGKGINIFFVQILY